MRIAKTIVFWVLGFWFWVFGVYAQEEAKQAAPPAEVAQAEPLQQVPEVPAEEEQGLIGDSLSAAENVTLDFKDADIRNVLKIISYKAGINVVATPEVRGNVTLKLVDVHWEKALDTIVKTYDFGYEWLSKKVIMVSTLERLAQQRKAQQEAEEMEPLDTQTFVLNFSKAQDIKTAIEKLVSAKGKITLEQRANALIITDSKTNLMRVAEVIKRLDRVTMQVTIEAKIIEATLAAAEKLGIDWTMKVSAKGSKRPTTAPFDPRGNSPWMTAIFPDNDDDNFPTNRPNAFPVGVADYDKGILRGDFVFGTLDFSQFEMAMEILQSRSDTKIISNPRITTLNNQEAKVFVGTIIPIPLYQFSREAGTMVIAGYKDQEVGVKLMVTPNINEQNFITLSIKPNVDEITGFTGPNNERPIIATRQAETKVMIKDGHTLVMGGLISEKKIKSKKGWPILKDIPVLDYIFSKKSTTVDKTELLFFITPRIVKEAENNAAELAKIEKEIEESTKRFSEQKVKM